MNSITIRARYNVSTIAHSVPAYRERVALRGSEYYDDDIFDLCQPYKDDLISPITICKNDIIVCDVYEFNEDVVSLRFNKSGLQHTLYYLSKEDFNAKFEILCK